MSQYRWVLCVVCGSGLTWVTMIRSTSRRSGLGDGCLCQHVRLGKGLILAVYRKVMVLRLFFRMGSLVSSKPVRISAFARSGRISSTSMSRLAWPRSTHCMTAIEVMSLVHDAMNNTVSISRGFWVSSERTPKALA